MKLTKLSSKINSKKGKRVGRGMGSGRGKTSGKGHKGQKARSGAKLTPGFEGGQMSLIRRLPKRGFNSPKNKNDKYQIVNIGSFNKFKKDSEITFQSLVEEGLIKKRPVKLKILGNGNIDVAVKIKATKFSKSAVKKIEKAGGKVEVVVT